MALNSKYVIAPSLEMYFVNKDTGLPLTNGQVFFYKDQARTELKTVYTLSGSPPYSDASYVPLPNPSILSAVGTFQDDGGANILPYYFPYDANGNVELYFIKVLDENDVEQFTREAWPNTPGNEQNSNQDLKNYVPNPQFLAHTNIPATDTFDEGEVRQAITEIAQGGWTFERPSGSTATDIVTFERFDSYVTNPTGNPRYALRVKTTVPDSLDAFKDIRLKYRDVNTFASSTQQNTISFSAKTNNGSSLVVNLILRKYFGAGGSSPTETLLSTFTFTSSETIFNTTNIFGSNAAKTIGPLNDDYIQILIRYPVNGGNDASVTDFIITPNEVLINEFPQTVDSDVLSRGVAGWMPVPNPDGFDLYLPLVLTKSGLEFDHSEISNIIINSIGVIEGNTLLCNGSQYETAGYSALGIPYLRLQEKVFDSIAQFPVYGTGPEYLSTYKMDVSPKEILRTTTNEPGSSAATVDGAIPTNFTFFSITSGSNTIDYQAFKNGTDSVLARCTTTGNALTPPDAGTSGFTITPVRDLPVQKQLFQIVTVGPGALAGTYFTFSTPSVDFYMWFTVDGVGADPAPGGTGIKVNLKSFYTADDVSNIVRESLSGYRVTSISTLAASSITAGSYFEISTISQLFYVWFKKGGIGADPNVAGRTGIEVDITTINTAAEVASKIQLAMNSKYFAVPDYRGKFLRMENLASGWDLDEATRCSNTSIYFGDGIGTLQIDEFLSHNHGLYPQGVGVNPSVAQVGSNPTLATNYSGGSETRPVNDNILYVIKY